MMFFCIKLKAFTKNIALVGSLERFIDAFYEKMDLIWQETILTKSEGSKFSTCKIMKYRQCKPILLSKSQQCTLYW